MKPEQTSCVVCGTPGTTVEYQSVDRLHEIPGTWSYTRCSECGLLYLNPPVDEPDIPSLYPDSYSPHQIRSGSGEKQNHRPFALRIKEWLVDNVINLLNGQAVDAKVLKRLNESSQVLDVGCGSGIFLNRIRKKTGCRVYGVDFSENAVQAAKADFDIEVHHGKLGTIDFDGKQFDLITAWFLLEHVPEPEKLIRAAGSLLKEDGVLILGLPNYRSFNARFFGNAWYHLDCPRHFHLWTPSTIGRVLSRNNLHVDMIKHDKSPWGFRGSLLYKFFGKYRVSRWKKLILFNPITYILMLPWTILVGQFGYSDIFMVYSSKRKEE